MSRLNQREQALKRVQQASFMALDLQLYLDTHPQCAEAFAAFQNYVAQEQTARMEYEKVYGSLTADAAANRCRYDWVDPYWPWRVEA